MSKNVKDYINILGNRLSNAFSLDEFGIEEELEFWALSAEHMSRRETPTFQNIISWIDLLYQAPVHFVYKKEGEKLVLIKRQLLSENLLPDDEKAKKGKSSETAEAQRNQYIQDFEAQLQNLEKKRQWDDSFKEHGISAHTIGNCEHIPLYKRNGEPWGIYVVGPFLKSPENMVPKYSIISRLLSGWLIELDQKEKKSQKKYESRIKGLVGNLGTGALNTESFSTLFLSYMINASRAESGAVVEIINDAHVLRASKELDESVLEHLSGNQAASLTVLDGDGISFSDEGKQLIEGNNLKSILLPYAINNVKGYILLLKKNESFDSKAEILGTVSRAISKLFEFRNVNETFSENMMDAFYDMVRAIEQKREKTLHHTPRLIAFTDMFGMLFGLDPDEAARLKLTAKLHDIGYAGSMGLNPEASIGSELSHPISGAAMISNFPVHQDVIDGIRTHHEWVNGKGKPEGLMGEEIPWTGKIISVFEYIVDFVESNPGVAPEKHDEMLEKLKESLIQRADEQFDMVLIPTVVQQITMLGWSGCAELGVES